MALVEGCRGLTRHPTPPPEISLVLWRVCSFISTCPLLLQYWGAPETIPAQRSRMVLPGWTRGKKLPKWKGLDDANPVNTDKGKRGQRGKDLPVFSQISWVLFFVRNISTAMQLSFSFKSKVCEQRCYYAGCASHFLLSPTGNNKEYRIHYASLSPLPLWARRLD